MKKVGMILILFAVVISISSLIPRVLAKKKPEVLYLYPGFVTKVECEGRLYLSSVGNEKIVDRQEIPTQFGCGLMLKPKARGGKTNLKIETSTGSIERLLVISAKASKRSFNYVLKPKEQ
jgi:hypothetical protein